MKRNKKKSEISVGWLLVGIFVCLLSIVAMAAGAYLCYYAIEQILSISDLDVTKALRSPAEYLSQKKEIVVAGAHLLLPGVLILLGGSIVTSVSLARILAILFEQKRIVELENEIFVLKEEISKSEKNNKK